MKSESPNADTIVTQITAQSDLVNLCTNFKTLFINVFHIVTDQTDNTIVKNTVIQILICSELQVVAKPRTIVNNIHQIISLIAATAIIKFQILVFIKSKSIKTLAITGSADIEKAAHINKEKIVLDIFNSNIGYINHHDTNHSKAGIIIQEALTIATLFHCLIIFSTSISNQTTNNSIKTLNCTIQSNPILALAEEKIKLNNSGK